jgi:hypothetical protein
LVEHTAHNGTDVGSNPAKPSKESFLMQLNLKNYQKNKIKYILKKNNFLFFALGANQNSQNWITLEQNLHKLTLTYTKTYNNVATKILQDSMIRNLKNVINSTFFFLKQKEKNERAVLKNSIINTLNSNQFTVLTFKLNKKIYTIPQFETINSYHYKKNISIIYQFLLTTLKSSTYMGQK